jgi:methionyl aminopeptidase
MYTRVKSEAEIALMRESGRQTALVLQALVEQIEVGMTTKEVADIARRELKAIPDAGKHAFFGYEGFPEVICISVNDEVVHGIPGKYTLQSGDIVGLDYGVNYRGMITDAARSVIVGKADPKDEKMLKATLEALDAGIFMVRGGCRVGQIAAAIQEVLERGGYGIVRDMVGHGVGHQVHEEPNIPNYGEKGSGPTLQAGMTIAIEPMSTQGDWRIKMEPDGWTIKTADGSRSGHFEDTVLITEDGAEILTRI